MRKLGLIASLCLIFDFSYGAVFGGVGQAATELNSHQEVIGIRSFGDRGVQRGANVQINNYDYYDRYDRGVPQYYYDGYDSGGTYYIDYYDPYYIPTPPPSEKLLEQQSQGFPLPR